MMNSSGKMSVCSRDETSVRQWHSWSRRKAGAHATERCPVKTEAFYFIDHCVQRVWHTTGVWF